MVNPQAMISVKVPVVPGIGVIAVGIAKAGADILNISGYDGGTGAARKHALQHAGLPVEIGVVQAHRALLDAGIRHKVEIWANGGMKTGEDVVKMILLGANRVGFATAAMMAIGCTVCRACNLGTCHVGIATQIKTSREAHEKGLKHFTELELERSVEQLVRLFKGIGEEIRGLTAQLGVFHLQDLVGRADLLEQVALQDQVDLAALFEPAPVRPRAALEPGVGILLIRPRNSLTSIMSDLILQTVATSEREVTYQDSVTAIDRALGSRLAGELARIPELLEQIDTLHLRFGPSSLAGNGFAAWATDQVDVLIEGGAQDGVAKGANGGRVAVMKGLNHDGERIDGSVGKGFAYGAQGGILLVQGNADFARLRAPFRGTGGAGWGDHGAGQRFPGQPGDVSQPERICLRVHDFRDGDHPGRSRTVCLFGHDGRDRLPAPEPRAGTGRECTESPPGTRGMRARDGSGS